MPDFKYWTNWDMTKTMEFFSQLFQGGALPTELNRKYRLSFSAQTSSLSLLVALVESETLLPGEKGNTESYYANTGVGGNSYILVDAINSASRPVEDKGSIIHVGHKGLYLKGLFPNGIFIEQFGASPNKKDNKIPIEAAFRYTRKNNIGQLNGTANTYQTSPITLQEHVAFIGPSINALNINYMTNIKPEMTGALVLQAAKGSKGDFILANKSSRLAGLQNMIIDATHHKGDVIVFGDNGAQLRNNNYLKSILVWKGTGSQIKMSALNKGPFLENVFCRGGDNRDTAISNYGIYDESQDSKFVNVFAAFCRTRCIFDAGGAGRRTNIDAWGCQKIGVEVTHSVTYFRLQVDGNGECGLLLNEAQYAAFTNFVSLNNGHQHTINKKIMGDVEVLGDCKGSSFSNPQMKGSKHPQEFAFYQHDNSMCTITISGATISTSYKKPFNSRAEAYWELSGNHSTNYKLRITDLHRLNSNTTFNQYEDNTPAEWSIKNKCLASQEIIDVPYSYRTALKLKSSAEGFSGIQHNLNIHECSGATIRVKGIFKGSGATYMGNQLIQIYDGLSNPSVVIPNNSHWNEVAISHELPFCAEVIQVRIIASNSKTANLELLVTALTIDRY